MSDVRNRLKMPILISLVGFGLLVVAGLFFAFRFCPTKSRDLTGATFTVPFTWEGETFDLKIVNDRTRQEEEKGELRSIVESEARKSLTLLVKRFNLHRAAGTIHCRLIGNAELYQASCEDGGEGTGDRFDPDANTPLQVASSRGDIAAVRSLIQTGINVSVADQQGNTALMRSAQLQGTGVLELLISAGANVNARNLDGRTALRVAVDNGKIADVRLLLKSGADANIADAKGWTPLMNAMTPEIAQTLIAAGADVNAANDDGETALMIAAQFGSPSLVKTLLGSHADMSVRSKSGRTALDLAKLAGKAEVTDLLRNAKPRARG